ncbi:MAG TPA: glycerol-3-phosphate 1-O-acyltransferase PlsY [Gemmatimonadaceae bacterium]|nr:glycerol-3-phosphate 1-O-acyltransferase PlsY [Gemmatimonadaceae bacterium]
MNPLIGVLISYLAGSIPFAYLAGKARGVDLRQHGSGNLGASNAWRTLGPRVGAMVYLFDTLKGFLPVTYLPQVVDTGSSPVWWSIAFGMATVVGHVRPIFLMGKGGGKGVATGGGVFFGLAPIATLIAAVVFAIVLSITRISSVSSLSAAVALPVGIAVMSGIQSPLFFMSVAISLLVFWTHRTNIERLKRGEEPKVGMKARVPAR